MLSFILYFVLMFLTCIFMVVTYCDYRETRDNAYICFFTVAAVLLIAMTFGFLHFEPWLHL